MRYWRVTIGYELQQIIGPCGESLGFAAQYFEKVDMIGTILSNQMVRPRLSSIGGFTIRMSEDLLRKGIQNSSISIELLNFDGIYDGKFFGNESIQVEVDGRIFFTGKVSRTELNHPNFLTIIADTNFLGLDNQINLKISSDDYPNVPDVNDGNFGNIIGGTVSDEGETTPAGLIPCYRVDTGKYLLAWHPCYALLGAYKNDGTDIYSSCTLSNPADDKSYILYSATVEDIIWANASGLISPKLYFTKDSDADKTIDIKLSIAACRYVLILWGDSNQTLVTGPVTEQIYSHTYADTNSYQIELFRDVRKIEYFECSDEPISGTIEGFEALGESCESLVLNNTDISGSIISINHLRFLKYLNLLLTNVSGSTSHLEEMIYMEDLRISNTNITGSSYFFRNMVNAIIIYANSLSLTGDMSNFSNMPNLTDLRIRSNSIDGSIASINTLLSLKYLMIDNNTTISGNINNLSGMTEMIQLRLNNTAVSGDLSSFATMPDLTLLNCYNNNVSAYTTTTLPNWDNCDINVSDLGLTTNEVNAFLIDVDAQSISSTKTLDISGTNQPPVGPGITAKNSLIAKGWTVITS